jgi:RNA polymerase sigma-70 factor (ECF subfamily)
VAFVTGPSARAGILFAAGGGVGQNETTVLRSSGVLPMSSAGSATSCSLLRQLAAPDGREDAWRTFFRRYQPLLLAWGRNRGLQPEDAEEVAGRVLDRLARKLPEFQYDPTKRFRAYLRVVVENAIRDYREELGKPGHRGSAHPDAQEALAQLAAADSVDLVAGELDGHLTGAMDEARQLAERVRAAVDEKTWLAFYLTAVEGRPAAEVAGQLGIKVGNVYVYRNRVARRLRELGDWPGLTEERP